MSSACTTGCGSDAKETADAPALDIQSGTVITVREGTLRGKVDGDTRAFVGIPYAKAPLGERRWAPPEALEAWDGERDATAFGHTCPQAPLLVAADTIGEDCLFLNVWTPSEAPAKPLPTMVWLHGGGFAVGAGSSADYDGKNLVSRGGVVLVSLNYRLGALGALAHPALTEESSRKTCGNYGVQDQTLALEWVKRNIRAFGGDPDNVMLFGESAGSVSTCVQMVSNDARGLFHRAAMESGVCLGFGTSLADAEQRGVDFAAQLGCTGDDVLACLRGKTADEITTNSGDALSSLLALRWAPIADGVVLPSKTDSLDGAAQVPVILGTNHDEANLFLSPLIGNAFPQTADEYTAQVGKFFPDHTDAVVAEYPPSDFDGPAAAFAALVTDSLFVCPTRRMARATSAAGMKTYLYSFEHVPDATPLPGLGVVHSAEIPYVFGNSSLVASLQPAEAPLVDTMLGYWTEFAKTGTPNAPDAANATEWPLYEKATDEHLTLNQPPVPSSKLKEERCDFLDTVPPPHF